jgi:tRNA U55 pseudouridine synthase TruB
MAVYVVKDKHPLEDLETQSIDDLADEIWSWCKMEMSQDSFKKCLSIIEGQIKQLPPKT